MNAVIFAFTARGRETARRIRDTLAQAGDSAAMRVPAKLAGDDCPAYSGSLTDFTAAVFHSDALIYVGACGIALRAVAPHVASKLSDPAVLCVDEAARFVVPILSGHVGGANRLANRLAAALDAVPVITTATDVNGRFSVDAWAAERDMAISSMALAKRVSAEILKHDIPFCADAPLPDALAAGLVPGEEGELGICVSVRDKKPFKHTLLLTPRRLWVGIGCRRGISESAVADAVDRVFRENGLRPEAVRGAASIDVKSNEPGLLAFCAARGWPLRFYSAEALEGVRGSASASEFVKKIVGVDNVCERAALAGGGRLIVKKAALDGVTVAVAEMEWGIDFGEDSRGGHWAR